MYGSFQPLDILVGDRGFCAYADIFLYRQSLIDILLRNHQSRKEIPESSAVSIVTENDRWVTWTKPEKRPEHLDQETWAKIPETQRVRQITLRIDIPGFRSVKIVLITTLKESDYSTQEIAEMYRARWLAEVSFRNLKQTLHADILRCKTPEMIQRELWMRLIAYNAICYLQKQASNAKGVPLERLSFKGSLQVMRAWEHRFMDWKAHTGKLLQNLFENIVAILLPDRPNRVEPRVNKRRPKIIRLMTKPRPVLKRDLLQNLPGSEPLKCPLFAIRVRPYFVAIFP